MQAQCGIEHLQLLLHDYDECIDLSIGFRESSELRFIGSFGHGRSEGFTTGSRLRRRSQKRGCTRDRYAAVRFVFFGSSN
jgi:hypothetical protein